MKKLTFALLALLAGLPAVLAGEPAPAPGALTLESSPAVRFFTLFTPAGDDAAQRNATGHPLTARAPATYDREFSDSFTRHASSLEPAALEERPAPSRPVFTAEAVAPRPTTTGPDAAPFDWSVPVVAPAASPARFELAPTLPGTGGCTPSADALSRVESATLVGPSRSRARGASWMDADFPAASASGDGSSRSPTGAASSPDSIRVLARTSFTASQPVLPSAVAPQPETLSFGTYTTISDTNQSAPGRGYYTSFYNSVLSGSNIATIANSHSTGSGGSTGGGIYAGTLGGTGLTRVVDVSNTAPGRGTFANFSSYSLSGSNVVFSGSSYDSGSSGTNSYGLYSATASGTGLTTLADASQNAPNRGKFSGVSSFAVSGGTVFFAAVSYATGSSGLTGGGVYTATIGSSVPTTVADVSQAVPGHGNFVGLQSAAISGNNLGFLGVFFNSGSSGSTGEGLYTATVGGTGLVTIASTDRTAPGRGIYTAFGDPVISGNNVGFYAYSYASGSSGTTGQGLYTATVGITGASLVADVSQTAPGRGNYQGFSSPVFSGSNFALEANSYAVGSSGTVGQGLYTGTVGVAGLTLLADVSQTAPGRGNFSSFSSLSYHAGNLAFLASSYDTGSSGTIGVGVYLYENGSLLDVASKGESFLGSTISSVNFIPDGFDGSTLTFGYTLSNGVSGFATLTGVPEPTTWLAGALTLTAAGLTLRRRPLRADGATNSVRVHNPNPRLFRSSVNKDWA